MVLQLINPGREHVGQWRGFHWILGGHLGLSIASGRGEAEVLPKLHLELTTIRWN
jgi:hypothetical protein